MGGGPPDVPPPAPGGGGNGGSVQAEALQGDHTGALGSAAERAATAATCDAAAAGCGRATAGDPATSTPVRGAEAPRPRHSCPGGIQTAEPLEALAWAGSAPLGVDSISGPSSLAGGGGGGGDTLLLAAAAMAAAAGAANSAPPALSLATLGLAGSLPKVDSGQLLVSPNAAAALAPDSSVASSESGLSPAMRRACGPGPLLAVSPPPVRPRNASGDSANTPLSSTAAAARGLAGSGELPASPPLPTAGASLAAEGVGSLLGIPPGLDADATGWQSDQSRQQSSRHDLKLLHAALQQQQQQQVSLQQGGQTQLYGTTLAQPTRLNDLPAAMAALGIGGAAPQAVVGGEAPGQNITTGWQAAAASAAIQAQLTQQRALADAVSAYAQAQAQAQAAVQAQMQQVALERRVLELQALQSQQQQQQQLLAAQAAQQLQGQPFSAWQSLALAQQQQQAGLLGPDILSSSSLLGALGLAAAAGGAGRRGGRQSEGAGGRDTRRSLDKGAPAPRPPPRSRDEPPDFRRIFIGNIGWWVDEELLRQSFERFGTIIDVQIMWNTKMRGKGKKVNREFGFLSFSTPDEAATAIRWMHGAVLEGLTKDGDGLTVQYEAQGTSKPAGSSAASAAVAAAAQAALHGAPSPVHAAGLLQQQLQLQQTLHAQQVQGLSMAGALPPLGLALGGLQHSGGAPSFGGTSQQPLALQLSQPRLADVQPQAPSMTAAAQQLMAAAAAAAAAASGAPPPPLL